MKADSSSRIRSIGEITVNQVGIIKGCETTDVIHVLGYSWGNDVKKIGLTPLPS